ncbi:MFS transporter [Streptomyces sp. NBC_01525]|uniref:MFS transporter n=1 Tax=Streptomyces sp. NBC_01525 TaxID=2903893 RepID=UPI0038671421
MPAARLGLVTVVLGHAVMVSVMTMTPIHLAHHDADLSVVGFSVSLHIAGMYALSPLIGRLADRLGRIPVILLGQALHLVTATVAGLAGSSHAATVGALFTLGLGWSCVTIAGSTLLTESLPAAQRSEIQGLADTHEPRGRGRRRRGRRPRRPHRLRRPQRGRRPPHPARPRPGPGTPHPRLITGAYERGRPTRSGPFPYAYDVRLSRPRTRRSPSAAARCRSAGHG